MSKFAEIRKALAAFIATVPLAGWIAGDVDWRTFLVAALTAVGVWLVPNRPPAA